MGLTSSPKSVAHEGRTVRLSVNPLGITPEMFAITPSLNERIATLKKRFAGKCEIIFVSKANHFLNLIAILFLFCLGMRLVIGVDRLNPCRGLPQKLLAFENLLTKYAQWRGKAIFVLVVREPWGGNWSQFGELRAEVRFFSII